MCFHPSTPIDSRDHKKKNCNLRNIDNSGEDSVYYLSQKSVDSSQDSNSYKGSSCKTNYLLENEIKNNNDNCGMNSSSQQFSLKQASIISSNTFAKSLESSSPLTDAIQSERNEKLYKVGETSMNCSSGIELSSVRNSKINSTFQVSKPNLESPPTFDLTQNSKSSSSDKSTNSNDLVSHRLIIDSKHVNVNVNNCFDLTLDSEEETSDF